MKINRTAVALAAVIGLGALGAGGAASAHVVCNSQGDCWHTDYRDHYPRHRMTYHNDDWYFHQKWEQDKARHWREMHESHGYYDNGQWVERRR
jgi:hypothetical protein